MTIGQPNSPHENRIFGNVRAGNYAIFDKDTGTLTFYGSAGINGLGALKVGAVDDGNYAEIKADGTLVFYGDATYYLDELGPLIDKKLQSLASDVEENVAEGSISFKTGATTSDYIILNYQFNHDKEINSAVLPHLRWWQISATMPNWLIQYRWQVWGQAKTTAWISKKFVSHAFEYSSGTLCQITGFGSIEAPASEDLSAVLQLRLIRDTTNASGLFAGADGLASTVDAVSYDIHKRCNTPGSDEELTK